MGKVIAVHGAPCSGKTSLAMKLAQDIYCETTDSAVIFLSPDLTVPSMGLLFPNYKPDEVFSLGDVLDNTEVTEDDVLHNLITVKTMKNFGCLGFRAGDTRLRFASPTQDKVNSLFSVLTRLSGYLIVDCTNDETDLISKTGMSSASQLVRITKPDLKSMAFLSCEPDGVRDCGIGVVNCAERDLYYPIEDTKSLMNGALITLPYCLKLKQQLLDGRMTEQLKDKKYRRELRKLTNILI